MEVHKAPFLQGFERHANDEQSVIAKVSSASSYIFSFLLDICSHSKLPFIR